MKQHLTLYKRNICHYLLKFIIVYLLFATGLCYGEPNRLQFKNLNARNGLSQNWVRSIFQDSYGFLWFGTDNGGINKYDGYNFTTYDHDVKTESSISNNTINCIIETAGKELWVGTREGINIYNREKDEFVPYDQLKDTFILGFYELDNGKIIVVSDEVIYLLDQKTNTFSSLCTNLEKGRIQGDFLTSVEKDKNNNLWVGSSLGLWLIDTTRKSLRLFQHDKNNPQSLTGNIITSLYKDVDGNLWVGTRYNGISIMKPYQKGDVALEFIHIKHDLSNPESISQGQIRTMTNDAEGNIWIGIENGGLNILKFENYHAANYSFDHYRHTYNDVNGLSSNSIYSIYKDNQQTMWIGTFNGGVNYYNKLLFQFQHIEPKMDNRNGLNDNFVNTFMEIGEDMWIGTEKGLDIYNRKADTYTYYVHDQNNSKSLGSNAVWSVMKDRNNNIWVGTWAGGLNLFDRRNGTFTKYLHHENDSNSLLSDNVFSIIEDDDGYLWIACMDGGLSRFDYSTNTFTSYRYIKGKDRLADSWVRTLLQDSYGLIWISMTNSIQVYNKKTDTFITFREDHSDSTSISYNGAIVFFEDSRKNLWIGTEGGLNLFHRKDSTFSYYRMEEGLPNNVIKGICEDDHGNLWISTNKGISKFKNGVNLPDKPEFENFDVYDGLQGDEFNRRSAYKDKQGRMYFGGTNGYNVFHPDSIHPNLYKPPVVFTDFLLFNEHTKIGGEKSVLSKHITVSNKIVLDYNQSVFTIYYAALNYLFPEKNQYAYQLEGFEKKWNYVGNRRSATYTNLNPGKYVFKVKASNNDGLWNDTPVSIVIIITPPWWMTWWFRILVVFTIISSFVGFYFFRMNIVKKQNKELEVAVEERTAEVREKNRILVNQTNELNEINTLLEERQQKIEQQAEELLTQNETIQEAYEKVSELNSMKDKFISIIGHDLKNPIHTIMGFSELLKSKIDTIDLERRNKYISSIEESSKTTYSLLENLLQWARSQSGRVRFEPGKVQLSKLVNSVLPLLKEQYQTKQIKVTNKVDEKYMVYGDLNMIETILRNLIGNAIKFTPTRGNIEIDCNPFSDPGFVVVTVSDSGIGISQDKIDKLFRIDSTFSSKGTSGETGTGLGLILCAEFISKHKGKIWVESQRNEGSKFNFTLPVG